MSEGHVQRHRGGLTATEIDLDRLRQKALLVGTYRTAYELPNAEASMQELARLVDTAGADTVGADLQRRDRPDPATYVGSGKADELAHTGKVLDIDLVVFSEELTPAQQRNLEQIFECDVVDRVALILDIFAQHATSQEGMLQVELAQLKYRLPRLRGRGKFLSQQGAGIGTRGPGETALEVDRRRIQRRMTVLERKLATVARTRGTQRKARQAAGTPQIALVGYTNSGKSTLLNRLAASQVLVEDRLFSTLDPTTRRVVTPTGDELLVTDTVGFVRDLPHDLVEAFTSTLDVVREASLLVHVVDASELEPERQMDAVHTVIAEIGAQDVEMLIVANKADAATPDQLAWFAERGALVVSAKRGDGIPELLEAIRLKAWGSRRRLELCIPYDRGDVLAQIHRVGRVLEESADASGMRVIVDLPAQDVVSLAAFTVGPGR
ncbi:MAG: GTPase HflX [Acidimicrobiia bacterium]